MSKRPSKTKWDKDTCGYCFCVIGNVMLESGVFVEKPNIYVTVSLMGLKHSPCESTTKKDHPIYGRVFVFNEILVIPVPAELPDPESLYYLVSVKNGSRLLCSRVVRFQSVFPDVCTTATIHLREGQASPDISRMETSQRSPIATMSLNFYYTSRNMVETPEDFALQGQDFLYPVSDLNNTVKPGDIILYNRPGPFSALYHVTYGVMATHCGIVLKPTSECHGRGINDLLVFEFSSNFESTPNCSDGNVSYCCPGIYPLEERVHTSSGTEIWHMPLRSRMEDPAKILGLTKWALQRQAEFATSQYSMLDSAMFAPFPFQETHLEALKKWGFKKDFEGYYCEYYSPSFVFLALRYLGFEPASATRFVTIEDILNLDEYGAPVVIRCRKDYPLDKFRPDTSSSAAVSGSSPVATSYSPLPGPPTTPPPPMSSQDHSAQALARKPSTANMGYDIPPPSTSPISPVTTPKGVTSKALPLPGMAAKPLPQQPQPQGFAQPAPPQGFPQQPQPQVFAQPAPPQGFPQQPKPLPQPQGFAQPAPPQGFPQQPQPQGFAQPAPPQGFPQQPQPQGFAQPAPPQGFPQQPQQVPQPIPSQGFQQPPQQQQQGFSGIQPSAPPSANTNDLDFLKGAEVADDYDYDSDS